MPHTPNIAVFVTPHGFGHASRAAAVMTALGDLVPGIHFDIFTTTPRWFFTDSLRRPFGYHAVRTDIGMVQRSPLEEDAVETCLRLDRWLPFNKGKVTDLAARLKALRCHLVICDISPLGIAAARQAGLPSVLIENFTWDWIYRAYFQEAPGLERHATYLQSLIGQTTRHIQTDPVCRPIKGSLLVPPIARTPRLDRDRIRRRLGLPENRKMVVVSMGGVPDRFEFLNHLTDDLGVSLVIPGCSDAKVHHPQVHCLDTHSPYYHPDLLAAADGLIGKAGYSTLAEAYHAGLPFGFVNRRQSPESAVLERFLTDHMASQAITPEAYAHGRWIRELPRLLALPRRRPASENGAVATARAIKDLLD